jgi:flagellar basal body rod protein FlgG
MKAHPLFVIALLGASSFTFSCVFSNLEAQRNNPALRQEFALSSGDAVSAVTVEATTPRGAGVAVDGVGSIEGQPEASCVSVSGVRLAEQLYSLHLQNILNAATIGYRCAVAVVEPVAMDRATCDDLAKAPGLVQTMLCEAQGAIEQTQCVLDVAIEGAGYFGLASGSDETFYTRAGRFRLDDEGMLVGLGGRRVVPAVQVPTDILEVVIADYGLVRGRCASSAEGWTDLGQIQLWRVKPGGVMRIRDGALLEVVDGGEMVECSPATDGMGSLRQGFVERSNVESAREAAALAEAVDLRNAVLSAPRAHN